MYQYQGMFPVIPMGNGYGQIQYPNAEYYNQRQFSQMQEKLWEIQIQHAKIQQNLQQAREMSRIRCEEAECKAQISSDIKMKKEFQQTQILFGSNGQILLEKNLFGENLKGQLPFSLTDPQLFVCVESNDDRREVLIVTSQNASGKSGRLVFWLNELQKRHLAEQFERAGLICGFGEKKEAEIRNLIVQNLVQRAVQIEIPKKHGWIKDRQGVWVYIYPEMLTWEEVRAWN